MTAHNENCSPWCEGDHAPFRAQECEGQCQFAESLGATSTSCARRCQWWDMFGSDHSGSAS